MHAMFYAVSDAPIHVLARKRTISQFSSLLDQQSSTVSCTENAAACADEISGKSVDLCCYRRQEHITVHHTTY
jgi:hypothetical protein